MPPFGNLYGMPVLAEESLAKDKEIALSSGIDYGDPCIV
jgi:prolyl-tRNA editing enzyme YbaK/EbsC (Cys-tRNA(Pro) deacylase)